MAKTPKKPSSVTQEEWDLLLAAMGGSATQEEWDLLLAAMNSPASSPTNSGLTRLEKKALSKKARLVRQTEDLAARGRERTLIKHAIESANNKEMDPVLAKMLDTEIRTAKTAGTVGSLGSLTAAEATTAEAAARLKEIIKLEAEGLEPHFAQSGQNVLDSERAALADIESRARTRAGTGLFDKEVEGQVKGRADAKYALKQAATRGTLEPATAKLLDAEIRAAKGTSAGRGLAGLGSLTAAEAAALPAQAGSKLATAAGAMASMTSKGSTISKGALGALAKATGKSVGFLTKAAGVLGWAGLAYTLYENTIGRRNESRQQEAMGLADAGMTGLSRAPEYGDAAYGRLLPGLASGSEALASSSQRTEMNNEISLGTMLHENQGALQQAAQVTPISFEEYMLRVKAEMAARGG